MIDLLKKLNKLFKPIAEGFTYYGYGLSVDDAIKHQKRMEKKEGGYFPLPVYLGGFND